MGGQAQSGAVDASASGPAALRDSVALELVESLYRAVLDRSEWHGFAARLSEAVPGAAVTLAIRCPEVRLGWDYFGAGFRDLLVRVAEDLRGALSLAAQRVEAFRHGFVDLGEAFPRIELESDPWFQQWIDPQGIAPAWPLCHAVSVEGTIVCWILVQPSSGFDPERLAAVGARLLPHLPRAFGIHCEIGIRTRKQRAVEEILDRLPTGVLLIDAGRRVIHANLSAQRMIALNDGISMCNAWLRGSPEVDGAIQAAIQEVIEAASRGDLDQARHLSIPTRSGRRPFLLAVAPLLRGVPGSPVHDAVAVAFLASPDALSTASVQALEAVYGLTPAEAAVVRGLVRGHTLEEIAARRRVTSETTRSQLKQVFAKTRTRRQAELIRLVATGVSPLAAARIDSGDEAS